MVQRTITPRSVTRRNLIGCAGGPSGRADRRARPRSNTGPFTPEAARSVPLDALDPKTIMEGRDGSSREPLYLICQSGTRSRQAAERCIRAGYDNVVCVEGGTLAWERAGLPVVRGPRMISLERQVRIAAGSLVVIGTALGAFVHPGFLGIAAFVGAGLVFAGITDTCGMGMLLARMPWNQVAMTTTTESQRRRKVVMRLVIVGGVAGGASRRRAGSSSFRGSPYRVVRARTGRLVRQLWASLLHRRRNRGTRQTARVNTRAVAARATSWMSGLAPPSRRLTGSRKMFMSASSRPVGSMTSRTTS